MKKKVFWLAAMAVTVSMASCSLEEVVEQPTPQAIGFSSFVGKPTKAVTQTDLTALQGENGGFNVWGDYADKADEAYLFSGRNVSYNTNQWEYEGNLEYWVANQQYYFAAVGPADAVTGANFDYAGGGHLSFTYTQTDLTKSTDVVYAEGAKKTATSIASDPGVVDFTFGHIMSWIKIKFVHKMTSGYKITVSDVKVGGVQTNATFTGSGVSTGNWTTPSTSAYLGVDDASVVQPDIFEDGATASPLDADGESCLVDFIAIPQTVGTLTISFKLTVVDSADNTLIDGEAMSSTVSSAEWASNNIYVYTANLEYGKVGIYPIQFTVSNFNWGGTDDDNILTINQN